MLKTAFLAAAVALSAALAPAQTAEGAKTPEKLVIAFQKQKDPKAIQETADKVAKALEKELGLPVEVLVPASYGATVQALVSNKAQVAYVSALPYLLAKEEAPVDLILAEVRDGKTDYNSIWVVRKDSPYQSLADLKGKRMVFTSPTSTSGYVMAFSRLVDEGLLKPKQDPKEFFSNVTYGGGYDKALLAVLNNQADAAAVSDYTMEGPKADKYLKAEQREQLRILTRTPGVPTHGIAVRTDLPEELRTKLEASLLKLSKEQPELLADVYGAAELKAVKGDEHVAGAIKAMENTGLGLKKLVE